MAPEGLRLKFLRAERRAYPCGEAIATESAPFALFLLVLAGEGAVRVGGREDGVAAGDVVYVPENSPAVLRATEPMTAMRVAFRLSLRPSRGDPLADDMGVPTVTRRVGPELRALFSRIAENAESDRPAAALCVDGCLQLIGAELCAESIPPRAERDEPSPARADGRISALITRMAASPGEPYAIPDMCRMTRLSASSLRRLFKRQTGMSPGEYLRGVRLAAASRLLRESRKGISEIASELGFQTANYFTRVFKERFGATPHAYRTGATAARPPAEADRANGRPAT